MNPVFCTRQISGSQRPLSVTFLVNITRTVTLPRPTADGELIGAHAVELLKKTSAGIRPVRLAGVGLSALHPIDTPLPEQLVLPFKDY